MLANQDMVLGYAHPPPRTASARRAARPPSRNEVNARTHANQGMVLGYSHPPLRTAMARRAPAKEGNARMLTLRVGS